MRRKDCTKKNTILNKKYLEINETLMYTKFCCGMIAMKREVATEAKAEDRFSVERMSS